jgi:hypothetical protein
MLRPNTARVRALRFYSRIEQFQRHVRNRTPDIFRATIHAVFDT